MIADQGFELHPGAASDISNIWNFIAEDNIAAAGRLREDILAAIVNWSLSLTWADDAHI